MHRETMTRRHLPHWYRPGAPHFVTYRLAGSLPLSAVERLKRRRARLVEAAGGRLDPRRRAALHKRMFAAYDRLLDANRRVRDLAVPAVADLVAENLRHGDGRWYTLLAYCVMPNHVHAVFVPKGTPEASTDGDRGVGRESIDARGPLYRTMHSLKSYTANKANERLGRTGPFWQKESYDHWVRDGGELGRIVEYVLRNPVRARLCETPNEYPWSWRHPERLADLCS